MWNWYAILRKEALKYPVVSIAAIYKIHYYTICI